MPSPSTQASVASAVPSQASSSQASSETVREKHGEKAQQLQEALAQLGLGDRPELAMELLNAGEPQPQTLESERDYVENYAPPSVPSETSSEDEDEIEEAAVEEEIDDEETQEEESGEQGEQHEAHEVQSEESATASDSKAASATVQPRAPPPSGQILAIEPSEVCAASTASAEPLSALRRLQKLLNSAEADIKRLLVEPSSSPHDVQCDTVRVGDTYRCYLNFQQRKGELATPDEDASVYARTRPDRSSCRSSVCIFEAKRMRKGRLRNVQYLITLPATGVQLVADDTSAGDLTKEARYCGRLRSYTLSGASFVVYDDGVKQDRLRHGDGRLRRQMAAMGFHKSSTSQKSPLLMRMFVPSLGPGRAPPADTLELLETLRHTPLKADDDELPPGTRLLKTAPPVWQDGMLQSAFAGRACCASNKNMQLVDASRPNIATLQVGKLRSKEFNIDFSGCISPFQAFAAALAIFEQSSVRRRF